MRRFGKLLLGLYVVGMFLCSGLVYWLYTADPEYAYTPSQDKILNPESQGTIRGASADNSTIESADLGLGKEAFAEHTFGNEVFFTDIMGLFDGPFTLRRIIEAVIALRGEGTTNLQVRAAKDASFGGTSIKKGDLIETGIDVPKGAMMPIGMKIKLEDGELKAGITCMACHATVDPGTGKVALGAPNKDLNIGYILAMASNTASYFTHTDIQNLQAFLTDLNRKVPGEDGQPKLLPNPDALEEIVDRDVLKWPRGSNDTTIDFHNNPVQIPDSYTLHDHPYGWSGQGVVGPFKGLTAAINNAHAQNMDAMSQSEISGPVMQIDKEQYIGTLLQRAANPKFRYDPATGRKPSEFFAEVDPTPGVPGVNQLIPTPSFPRITYMSAVGLLQSEPGYPAWKHGLSMSAWMNSLRAPEPRYQTSTEVKQLGEQVFRRAQCASCHAGGYFTNNRIVPVGEIGTEPSRAYGFNIATRYFDKNPRTYLADTPVPLPKQPSTTDVGMTQDQREQVELGWAQEGTKGGYKVPSLLGLSWSAPYLHDGGVAVGGDRLRDLGIPGTLSRGLEPDPYNSLAALVDRKLRAEVMKANKADAGLHSAHVTGEGHSYWVDEEAGFTKEEQDALIRYLLTIKEP